MDGRLGDIGKLCLDQALLVGLDILGEEAVPLGGVLAVVTDDKVGAIHTDLPDTDGERHFILDDRSFFLLRGAGCHDGTGEAREEDG